MSKKKNKKSEKKSISARIIERMKEFTETLETKGLEALTLEDLNKVYLEIDDHRDKLVEESDKKDEEQYHKDMDEAWRPMIKRYAELNEKYKSIKSPQKFKVEINLPLIFEIEVSGDFRGEFGTVEKEYVEADLFHYIKSVEIGKDANFSKEQRKLLRSNYLGQLEGEELCKVSLPIFFPDGNPLANEVKGLCNELESLEKDLKTSFKESEDFPLDDFMDYYSYAAEENKKKKKKAKK